MAPENDSDDRLITKKSECGNPRSRLNEWSPTSGAGHFRRIRPVLAAGRLPLGPKSGPEAVRSRRRSPVAGTVDA